MKIIILGVMLMHILLKELIDLQRTSVFFAPMLKYEPKGHCPRCVISPKRAKPDPLQQSSHTYYLIRLSILKSDLSSALIDQSTTRKQCCPLLSLRRENNHLMKFLCPKSTDTKSIPSIKRNQ